MYCPSCERFMDDEAKYCGHCGMFLNKKSELLIHLSTNFGWIWRRSWAGFVAGFIGWIIVFVITRIIGQNASPVLNNLFGGMICGVFLGTVGGIIEESAYKAFRGGILGTIGGGIGGFLNIPISRMFEGDRFALPFSILLTWAIGGAFIGATSGLFEQNKKKIYAGISFGLVGGAIGGLLGSLFYGSIHFEFRPESWFALRLIEGFSGGLVGAVLWFFIGFIEKLYIFNRREDPKLEKKTCDYCGKTNTLTSWYCVVCGHSLQVAAPRKKIVVTPYRGMERVVHALTFLSWLFGVTGVITTPVIFLIFLTQDIVLAVISLVLAILVSYFMVVGFRFMADLLLCFMRMSMVSKNGK
ncbi:MAG: hypothetical protein JW871_06705 [Endomicrobiales bacterium]|nr:hypothetical protein [Endomicrobiales bacterium]